jgi:chondroitin AC lyase
MADAKMQPADRTPEEEVLHALAARSAALLAKDVEAFDRLLSDDFLYTDAAGVVLGKAAYIARYVEPPDVRWYLQDRDDLRARLYGEAAVVLCRVHDLAAIDDKALDAFFRATYVYVRQNNEWRCIAEQIAADQGDSDLGSVIYRLYATQSSITARTENVPAWLSAIGPDGSWSDIDYADQTLGPWKTSDHLVRLLTMARLYSALGAGLYQDAALRKAILAALDFWLAHDFQNPNWWHNQLGVPMSLGNTMLLMRPELVPRQVEKGTTILGRARLAGMTGANLTWAATVQLARGCLSLAPAVIGEAMDVLYAELKVVDLGQEGVQADWSFHQHDRVLYSGGYGQAYTVDSARFVLYAADTRFAAPEQHYAVLAGHILDGQQWMMRGDMFDYSAIGRQIVRPEQDGRSVVTTARRLAQLQGPRQEEFAAFASRGEGDPQAPPLVGNRHFWKSDFMAHQRAAYYTSVRMVSTRLCNTDGYVNFEGRQTNYIAHGATYIYRTGQEYRDIFPVWDWRRVPGVTCEQSSAPLDVAGLHVRGQTSFVGGVSDGMYGLAAMDLSLGALMAKKAWFYFDEEFICLGTGISCPTDNPVFTSVNQCLRGGDVTVAGRGYKYHTGGTGVHTLSDGWVHHDGVGYLFPATTTATISHFPQTGSWADIGVGPAGPVTRDVFSVWIGHGQRAQNASYQYTVYPAIDPETLAARAADQNVVVVSNTAVLQAVRHLDLGLCGVAFYQPGALAGHPGWNIAADQPCLVLLREWDGGIQLAVSNPQNQPLTVSIELDRELEGEGSTPLDAGRTRIAVVLPGGADAGSSVVRLLKVRSDTNIGGG